MPEYTVRVNERRTYRLLNVEAESPEFARDKVWVWIEDGAEPEDLGDCIDAEVDDVQLGKLVS